MLHIIPRLSILQFDTLNEMIVLCNHWYRKNGRSYQAQQFFCLGVERSFFVGGTIQIKNRLIPKMIDLTNRRSWSCCVRVSFGTHQVFVDIGFILGNPCLFIEGEILCCVMTLCSFSTQGMECNVCRFQAHVRRGIATLWDTWEKFYSQFISRRFLFSKQEQPFS